jgi:hypothetical protein
MAPINRALDRLRDASELAREVLPDDVAQVVPGGSDAGVWGAVVLARAASIAAHLETALPALSAEEPAVPAEEGVGLTPPVSARISSADPNPCLR